MSPTHSYSSFGTFTVELIVTSNNGCKDSTTQVVIIYAKPIPSFTINNSNQCINGNSFSFTNTSTIGSGSYTSEWYFGDGNTSFTASPSHNFTSSGSYNVKLLLTSNNGCKDSVSQSITVY